MQTKKAAALAAKTAEIDRMVVEATAADDPSIVPPLDTPKPAGKIKSGPANKTAAAGKIKSGPANKTAAAKPAKKAAKQAEAKKPGRTSGKAKKPATDAESRPEGVRERIWKLMQRKDGVTEREVCEALGWKKAGATISRAVKAAPFKVVKSKTENGRTVYSAASK